MLNKGNKLYSIINFKCPKCHHGDLYPTKLTDFSKIFQMNEKCSHCDQIFDIEPGFYWGAMYIGYMISSGIMLTGFAFIYFVFNLGIIPTFFIVGSIIFLLYGFIFRLARAIWINIYVNYNKKADQQPELYKAENQ